MKGKYLITTDNWFTAPDGEQYKAVWGNVEILEDNMLGVKTNRNSVNWYAKVGSEKKHLIVAGCQVKYACRSEEKPNLDGSTDWHLDGNGYKEKITPNKIYIAE